jgi:hypothetical protein
MTIAAARYRCFSAPETSGRQTGRTGFSAWGSDERGCPGGLAAGPYGLADAKAPIRPCWVA